MYLPSVTVLRHNALGTTGPPTRTLEMFDMREKPSQGELAGSVGHASLINVVKCSALAATHVQIVLDVIRAANILRNQLQS